MLLSELTGTTKQTDTLSSWQAGQVHNPVCQLWPDVFFASPVLLLRVLLLLCSANNTAQKTSMPYPGCCRERLHLLARLHGTTPALLVWLAHVARPPAAGAAAAAEHC